MKVFKLALLLTLLLVGQAIASPLPNAPHIVVSGSYKLSTIPDTLSMSLQIIEVGSEAKVARNEVEKRSQTLIDTAMKMGVTKKDINSSSLTISPRYDWNNRQQIYVGTEVSRKINIILRDLSKYDDLIQAVLDSSVARINSTNLTSSKHDELIAEAMTLAVANAKEKAALLTAGLPQKVGDVYAISMGSSNNYRPMQMEYDSVAKSSARSAFEPGSIEITKSVQVVFYLVNR